MTRIQERLTMAALLIASVFIPVLLVAGLLSIVIASARRRFYWWRKA